MRLIERRFGVLAAVASLVFASWGCGDDGTTPQVDTIIQQDLGLVDAPASVDAPITTPDGPAALDKSIQPDFPVKPDAPPPLNMTWTVMTTPATNNLHAVWGSGPKDVFAVGTSATVLHYDGVKWTKMAVPSASTLNAVGGSGPTEVMVGGYSGLANVFNGSTWTPVPPLNTKTIRSIWSAGAKAIYASCDSAQVLRFNGTAWNNISPPVPGVLAKNYAIQAIGGSGPGTIWAAGYMGTLLSYDGSVWKQVTSNTTGTFNGVYSAGPKAAFAVGAGGLLAVYQGAGWIHMGAGTSGIYAVHGSAPDNVFISGYNGAIYHHNGHGFSWAKLNTGSTKSLRGIWVAGPKEVFAVGDTGTILHGTMP